MSIGVYIHIPFCKSKCKYCDFNSYSNMSEWQERYINALCREISEFEGEDCADTIYFGGGTPTVLAPELLSRVMMSIKKRFYLTESCEITVECNPGTIDEKGLIYLNKIGINRLSIGLQSTDDKMLEKLGRIHSLEDFKKCFLFARKAGFENISLDLIYGLPGQTLSSWESTLRKAIEFSPEHISCYALKIEDGTPFAYMKPDIPDDDLVRDMYDNCVDFFDKNGFNRYEISNFAKESYESRHNIKYWQCDDFAGFGAGAYSCIGDCRYSNLKNIPEYCNAIEAFGFATESKTVLTIEDKMKEFCFLGLRRTNGISELEFKRRFNCEITEIFGSALEKNLKRGTLKTADGRILIPFEWIFVSNGILVDFV